MTPEQEKIAEAVIQKYKDNGGLYSWNDFKEVFKTTDEQRLLIAKTLRELNIICTHLNSDTRLTEIGWNFKGFENERKSFHTAPRLSDSGNEGLLVLRLRRVICEVSQEF